MLLIIKAVVEPVLSASTEYSMILLYTFSVTVLTVLGAIGVNLSLQSAK